LAEWLRDQGHDVVRVTDAGPDPGDGAILRRALAEGRILVTMDKDFGALVHRESLGHTGLIRLPHSTAAERIAILRAILRTPDRTIAWRT
jgi:predicted nuclease of predicted toxin-antitoxin system